VWRGRLDLPAAAFNQYNVRYVAACWMRSAITASQSRRTICLLHRKVKSKSHYSENLSRERAAFSLSK